MKFEEALMLEMAIMKTEREKVEGNDRIAIRNQVWSKLKSGNFKIKLRPERCEDVEYIARMLNNKSMQRDAYFAAGLKYKDETPDFTERIKSQRKFENNYKKDIEDYCRTKLIETIKANKIKGFVDKVGNKYQMVFKIAGSSTVPYVKFDYYPNTKDVVLISCHDSKFSFKKKSFNDTNSYKFGNREALKKVKQDMEKNKEIFK